MHKVVNDERLGKHLRNVGNLGQTELPRFDEGDFVLVARKVRSNSPKLQVVWRGPYVIAGTVHKRVYQVRRLGATSGTLEEVHVRRLRRYADRSLNVTEALVNQAHYDDDEFLVEGIIEWKPDNTHGVLLKVKWSGYNDEWDTWEPIDSLYRDVPQMIKVYMSTCPPGDSLLKQWLRDNA